MNGERIRYWAQVSEIIAAVAVVITLVFLIFEVRAAHFGFDDAEALRQQLLVVNLWSIYEKTCYSQQYGLVGPAEWERFQTRICGYQQAGGGVRVTPAPQRSR